jgi:putative endopeptidase
MRHSFFRFLTAAIVLYSCSIGALAQVKAFDTSRMNREASACDDFFEFANGTWVKNTEVPPSETRWGTFNILIDQNTNYLHEILENAAKAKSPKGSDPQLIGDFYESCMNEAAIEKAGIKPIQPYLNEVEKIATVDDVKRVIPQLHNVGLPAVFGFGVGPDLKESNAVLASLGQGGLSLPNTDYYTNVDPRSIEIRQRFVQHMTNMFKLLGDDAEAAKKDADTVLAIQTRLAKASLTPVERRNPNNNYNKIKLADAQAATPNFDWTAYLTARNSPSVTELNMVPPKFFAEFNTMLTDVPVDQWKTYLRWMTLNATAQYLPKRFADERFDFFSRYLNGQKEQQPRWKICVQATDQALGEALGMQFVKTKFTPEQKAKMNELIDNLIVSLRGRINSLAWMSPETKQQAINKLTAFKRKIGYPDQLRGYKGLVVTNKSFADNVRAVQRFQIARNFEDLGKPRDKSRWGFSPPTVNAGYNSTNNDITFPAGILQPPFFNSTADDAINYGAIGGVIGHEISHGFDDSGSQFNGEGNLLSWWTQDDRKKFEERAACVIKQFDSYEVQPGVFMNGKLTLGENIGDFAGLTISYYAYLKSLEGKPRPANIDGFTPEQRFFLGWAQVWAAKSTPEAERSQVKGDPHALAKWRVNGPMSNMPEFAKAWGCKEGDRMVRKDACLIW